MEGFEEFIIEGEVPEFSRNIRNIRDAQNLNLKKILTKFFNTPSEVDAYLAEAKTYSDFEIINVKLLSSVYYMWSQIGRREIPKNFVSVNDKPKKGEVRVAPNMEIQKEVYKSENINNLMKADIIRYMRYILSIKK